MAHSELTITLRSYKFALLGAHAKIDCHACHTVPWLRRKNWASNAPTVIAAEDPHGGKLARRLRQVPRAASMALRASKFDHDLSEFPLLGLHRVVSCAQCHATLDFGGRRHHVHRLSFAR